MTPGVMERGGGERLVCVETVTWWSLPVIARPAGTSCTTGTSGHGARGDPWLGRSLGVRTLLVLGEAGLRDVCGTDGLPERWIPHTGQGRL